MGLLIKTGYGQVEPNHLSAQRNGQIYAQLPCKESITLLQNGQFVKYDYAAQECNYSGNGEFMLVFNEIKLYDERKQTYKDFAYKVEDFTDKKLYPRVFKTMVGDIMTTNMVEHTTAHALLVGKKFSPSITTGILTEVETPTAGSMVWIVAKAYTMADGQPAVKLQRIA